MPSKARNFRLPPALDEAVELRVKQLGYKSSTAYFLGLIRYDLAAMSMHELSRKWSEESDEDQAATNARLLENAKKGVGEKGVLLHHIVEKVVDAKLAKKRNQKR